MTTQSLAPTVRLHIVGAGPVGLLLTALLQSSGRFAVHLYEKRREYTRTRMVKLASYLVADSVASYCTDNIDNESIQAIFEPSEIDEGLAFRRSIPPDLMAPLPQWALGFCPAEHHRALIERSDRRARVTPASAADDRGRDDGERVADASARRRVDRRHRQPVAAARPARSGRDHGRHSKYLQDPARIRAGGDVPVGQVYDCNEYCKYY